MATSNEDLDPARMQRVASEKLQQALESLDRHIEALTAPTMELALAQRQRAMEGGNEELEPSALIRKFVSQAGAGGQIGVQDPGRLGPDASDNETTSQWDESTGGFSRGPRTPLTPTGPSRGPSPIAGKTNVEAQRLEEEQIRIPQYGDWQLDTILKLASQVSGKRAISNYESYASGEQEAGRTPMDAGTWLENQGPMAAGNVSGTFASLAEKAVPFNIIHQRVLRPLMDIGFGASNAGASLGYSPQGEGLGGGFLGASHYFGIPNPIAAFTSPAGKQGMGQVVNAAEAAIGGTGIGIGEANALRSALASQGWSNQRTGGIFGFTEGGEQESLALAMEPLIKKGFKNPEVLSEFTSALKLGTGNIGELTKGIENLAETAKMTHQTLEEEAVKAQEFMAKSVEGGSTMIHGLNAYGEIAKATKINPLIVQGINEGQFGQVQALTKGVMPWEIQGMSGNAAALNAWETVKKVAAYVPKQSNTTTINKVTGKEEITESAQEKELSYIHMLEPSVTAEQAKRLKEIGPKLEAIQGGLGEASTINQHRYAMEQSNEVSKYGAQILKARNEWAATQNRVNQLKEEISRTPEGGFFGGQKHGELEEKLRKEEETLHNQHSVYTAAMSKASKSGTLNKSQEGLIRGELEGPKGLYATAAAAGLQPNELAKIKKEDLWKQSGDIAKALENLNKVNIEKQNEENAKIELAGPAKAFFKLKFPAASAKSEANEGGPATASKAASPNPAGETASEASLLKASEKAQRAELTVAGS
jgi:hypothetical protein